MALSLADYKALIVQLLPRGIAWQGTQLRALVQGFAGECERVDGQGETLLVEAFPQSTVQCLPDWERVAGIPSAAWPVVVPSTNVVQRQANLVAKLSAQGGQSRAYLIAVASRMGYTVTSITEYRPFAAGVGFAGCPLYDAWWAFTFTVNVGALPAGEVVGYYGALYPLRRHYNLRLEAVIGALKPGQTTALYAYP